MERLAKKKSFQFATISYLYRIFVDHNISRNYYPRPRRSNTEFRRRLDLGLSKPEPSKHRLSPQTIINNSNVGSLVSVWNVSIGGLSGTPVVSNGIVYVTGSQAIWALNESTGKIIWVDGPHNQTALSYTVRVGVTIDKGILFSGTNHNLLVAVNATTGAFKWETNVTSGVVGGSCCLWWNAGRSACFWGKGHHRRIKRRLQQMRKQQRTC